VAIPAANLVIRQGPKLGIIDEGVGFAIENNRFMFDHWSNTDPQSLTWPDDLGLEAIYPKDLIQDKPDVASPPRIQMHIETSGFAENAPNLLENSGHKQPILF